MATRAATFTAKIHTLSDYHFRTRHGILPLPSGIDVASTLKYFSQTLLGVLKDVPSISIEMMRDKEQDHSRVALFPILDYKGLYHVIVQLVDVVPVVQMGIHVLGQSLLHTMVCLVPFLEHHYIDTLPYLVSSTMTTFPESLHQEIVDTLCTHLLPFSITDAVGLEKQSYATLSTSSILLNVFQYSKNSAHHFQLLECLMSLKKDVIKDLLCVIAHGTSVARSPAVALLFHYWPTLNPTPYDRRSIQNFTGWKPVGCQRENCLGGENNEAIQMCLDPSIAIGTGDHPPPLYVCQSCSDQIRQTETDGCHLVDILLPVQQISATCENKNCRSIDKVAMCTCCSMECASYNGNHPTRFCSQCHSIRHNNRRGASHVVHVTIESAWRTDSDMQTYLLEAIVALLKEAQPIADRCFKESNRLEQHLRATCLLDESGGGAGPGVCVGGDGNGGRHTDASFAALEERRLLSRYGVYLLVGTCKPVDANTDPEPLGRLLAMLFQWFDATAYLQDDQSGSMLERLKSEYLHTFLMDICETHFDVFASCLLPHPPEYARVGGHWDVMTNPTNRIKEGFNRLFCLVPYEIISLQVWGFIMGHWMEAIRSEVPEHELPELRMLLSKVLDPEMSPLGFDAHQMYEFFAKRFHQTKAPVQEQALLWLQILCELDVVVPLSLVFSMFNDGVQSILAGDEAAITSTSNPPERFARRDSSKLGDAEDLLQIKSSMMSGGEAMPLIDSDYKDGVELNLPCFVLMMDVLLKQMELQEVDPHQGLEHIVSREALSLMQQMIAAPWVGNHTCCDEDSCECSFCETCTLFYQLVANLLEYVSPVLKDNAAYSKVGAEEMSLDDSGKQSVAHEEVSHLKGIGGMSFSDLQQVGCAVPMTQPSSAFRDGVESVKREMADSEVELQSAPMLPLLTATVQTVMDAELQTVAIIPTEEVVRAVAHAITLSETDVGVAKVSIAQATIVDECEQEPSSSRLDRQASPTSVGVEEGTFWNTSQGRFKFSLDELPASLQIIYVLLKEMNSREEHDVLFNIFLCLEVLCFNADCLIKAAKEHRGFLIWCQENLFISSIWYHLNSEASHVAHIAVQLLLHCLTFPSGADTFWKIVEENFHHEDWKIRFSAVERVTVICRFLENDVIRQFSVLQSSMANAFSYLISSMDDVSPYVAQRASLYLDTMPNISLQCLCWCLEVQFDLVIVDRPMILQTLYQLYNCLSERNVLTWDFFLNRFDTLFLEVQVTLERSGEIAYPRDLRNTNTGSEVFTQKMSRVQEALSQSMKGSLRSLSVSLGPKLRYKRAMSAPSNSAVKQDKIALFSRQSSAPVLKRKSSKFGVAYAHHSLAAAHFPNHLFPDGHIKEHGSHEDHSFLSLFHRHMEMEDRDQDTIHLLVFLLMQFLSEPEHAFPSDEKAVAKIQNVVLRHLNLLLGFNTQDRGFCIPPAKMRMSPVFNAFLSNLPRLLDRNFKMATVLLPVSLPLLLYCPAPLRASSEMPHLSYSIWSLDRRSRHSWLSAVSLILYKYRYNTAPLSKQVMSLARIILNTLTYHSHRCKEGTLKASLFNTSTAPQSGERSRVSTQDTCNPAAVQVLERTTPPHSPVVTITGPTIEGKVRYHKSGGIPAPPPSPVPMLPSDDSRVFPDEVEQQYWKPRKMALPSEVDDTEPELEAIPESPKSESPDVDSLLDSIGDLEINTDVPLTRQATIQVESCGDFPADSGAMIMTRPPLQIATVATVSHGKATSPAQPRVELKMAQQLQAFHRSFDWPSVPSSQSSQIEDQVKGQSMPPLAEDGSSSQMAVEDAEGTFVRRMTVQEDSVYIGKLVTTRRTDSEEKELGHVMSASSSFDGSFFSKETKTTTTMKSVIESREMAGARPLEELNASRLEKSVFMRRVVDVPPYLFQPIQSHPITSKDVAAAADGRHGSDPRRKPVEKQPDDSTSPPRAKVVPQVPWTIEVHSPVKLNRMECKIPSPERLLAIGSAKSEVGSGFTDSLSKPGPEGAVDGQQSGTLLDKVWQVFDPSSKPKAEDGENGAPPLESVIVVDAPLVTTHHQGVRRASSAGLLVLPQTETVKSSIWSPGDAATASKSKKTITADEPSRSTNDNDTLVGPDDVFDQDYQPSVKRGLQRLYPGSFRRTMDPPQYGKDATPCPSPRPMKKAFDSHLEALYQSVGFMGGVNLEDVPCAHQFLPYRNREHEENREKYPFRQRRQRKASSSIMEHHQKDIKNAGTWKSKKGGGDSASGSGSGGSRTPSQQQPTAGGGGGVQRTVIEVIVDRCPECGASLERYSNEELGLCIVSLATIIHREPALIAPLLPEILHAVCRIASSVTYPWETETNVYLPGNARSVARQFLRCVLHQLSPSGVFLQIFQSTIDNGELINSDFFRTIAMALADFNELNPTTPLQLLFEGLNERRHLPLEAVLHTMSNVAIYMDYLQLEMSAPVWMNLLPQFDTFFRRLALALPSPTQDGISPSPLDVTPTLRILCSILRIQGLNAYKGILEPFSRIVSFAIQSCTFNYQTLLDLCHLCNRAFSKERDKLYMSRTVVFDLVQALKFKTNIPDVNMLKLVQFIVQDAGGTIGPSVIVSDIGVTAWDVQNMMNTGASECMRQHFADALDFVADVHSLGKIKSNFMGTVAGLNEDTLGGTLKAGIAQYLAVEITRANNREHRAINRYLPWLYNPPPAVQQGPKEFIDCVTHIRLLSWLLLGSLYHAVIVGNNSNLVCQPIPLEASCHVADHVQVILAGFAEQSKASVLHMSSLFHAFILCQLWTMYCEQLTALSMPGTEHYYAASLILADFWAKVTPGILQLLSHSTVDEEIQLAEMVTLHFLSLIEALIECNSSILAKLFPMWRPILTYNNQLPGHLLVRLKACENRAPPTQTRDEAACITDILLKWTQRLQFKMGQIELQSSAATQFYTV